MKFSSCGRLLATAGQDKVLRIWVLKDAYQFFQVRRNMNIISFNHIRFILIIKDNLFISYKLILLIFLI